MDRSLDSLSSEFKPKVFELLARLVERGVQVMIVQTGRTTAEHDANVAAGTSATSHSKHVPRGQRGTAFAIEGDKCDAIDLVPYETYQLHGADKVQWDASDPAFRAIGEESEKLDLRWGGRWLKPADPGHVELVISPSDRMLATEERGRPWSGVKKVLA